MFMFVWQTGIYQHYISLILDNILGMYLGTGNVGIIRRRSSDCDLLRPGRIR